MTKDMLKDALEAIAERAEPVDGMAERALRSASRRRRVRAIAGASLALALAIAVPVAVVQLRGEESSEQRLQALVPATGGLPSNTAAELRIAQGCMRNGPAAGSMGDPRPDLGKLPDFRLVVKQQVGGQYVAEVASKKGFVLCVGSSKEGNVEPPLFHSWIASARMGDFWSFPAPVRVDAITDLSQLGENDQGSSGDRLHAIVSGRVKPDVERVTVTWNLDRTAQATVDNGFFIARADSRMIPDPTAGDGTSKRVSTQQDDRVLSVTGYNAGGRAVYVWQPKSTDGHGFVPEDCTDRVTKPAPSLCKD